MARGVLLTGGGTGGHIFPMTAVADQLVAGGIPAERVELVGSRRGQEHALLRDSPYRLTRLPGRGLRRSWRPAAIVANIGAVLGLVAALAVALVRIGRRRPAVVVSFGGYAAAPAAVAAILWRRPLVLVELDAVPGAVHRYLARFAWRRCLAFGPAGARSVVTGVPVRAEVVAVDRSDAARARARAALTPPVEPGRAIVVIMSGSLGSARVNDAATELARRWASRRDRTIIHVTGRRDAQRVLERRPSTSGLDYRVTDFAVMAPLWCVADAAVCRAGATTVAELTVVGVPAVLVPLPGAPGGHQLANARVVEQVGGAIVVADDQCDASSLEAALDRLLEDEHRRSYGEAARTLGRPAAASAIAREIIAIGEWGQ